MAADDKQTENGAVDGGQRLDKWLWAARFFKTRSMASTAVSGGKVHADGQRVKPARKIRPGTLLSIHKDETQWEVEVLALSERRLGAPLAQGLYAETDASRERREAERERRARRAERGPVPSIRPSKRDRRSLERFKRTASEEG